MGCTGDLRESSMVGRLLASLGCVAWLRRLGILERDAAEDLVLSNRVKREGASRANAQVGDWVTT